MIDPFLDPFFAQALYEGRVTISPGDMTENEIQRAVFAHLRQRGVPGIFPFHPKNGSRDMRGRGAGIYTGLGVEPGIPDVFVIKGYGMAPAPTVYAMELKTEERRGRKPTKHELDQEACRVRLAGCGVITTVCYGLDEAIAWLEGCGLLKGAAQTQRRSKMLGDPENGQGAEGTAPESEGAGDPNAPPPPPPNPPAEQEATTQTSER